MSLSLEYLFFTFLSIAIQGLFALFEMSVVSFDKIRLHYYVSLKNKKAIWIDYLLKSPSRLFGTTLIGINTALQVGSECSRRFYESIHLDPDWAPVSQVLLVVVFGELVPMFAARRYPQQLALALSPFMFLMAKILQPLIWGFNALSHLTHRLMGKTRDIPLFFSREEVKMAFELREEGEDALGAIVRQVFQLKAVTAGHVMAPIQKVSMIPASAKRSDAQKLLELHYQPFIPLFDRAAHNIIAIAYPRDLLRLDEVKKVVEQSRPPWFIAKEACILDTLDQFRRNGQSVAVVLNSKGHACGFLTLDLIIDQLFGKESQLGLVLEEASSHIERTLSAQMKISEFNRQFQADLFCEQGDTLCDLILFSLDHAPALGETVKIGRFSFTIAEQSTRKIKTLIVHTS